MKVMEFIFDSRKNYSKLFIGDLITLQQQATRLEFFNIVRRADEFGQNLARGNFVLTVQKSDNPTGKSASVIIHHENVNPEIIAEKLENVQTLPEDAILLPYDEKRSPIYFVLSSFVPYVHVFEVVTKICSSDSAIHKLEFSGKSIGVIVNPYDLFGYQVCAIPIQDANGNVFAVVLCKCLDEWLLARARSSQIVLPMDMFFYENEYRCYYKNGQKEENPYYGDGGSGDFDFSRLPDNVFIDILTRLPFAEQMECRRVNKRWMTIGNSAVAGSTKSVITSDPKFEKMTSADFTRFLPIVANRLEKLDCNKLIGFWLLYDFDFEFVRTIPSFIWLREINLGGCILSHELFYTLMDKCPKLADLSAVVPRKPADSMVQPATYGNISKLYLLDDKGMLEINDPYLIAIGNLFPNVVHFAVQNFAYLTASCLNYVMERYGDRLVTFDLKLHYNRDYEYYGMQIGDFTGIGFGRNLTSVSMVNVPLVTDSTLLALANGCVNLETLDIRLSQSFTNGGLSHLAQLPQLKKLNVSLNGLGFNAGITTIAHAGHLEELIASYLELSADCLKALVRYCTKLRFLDIRGSSELTVDVAEEIATLFARFGTSPLLFVRTDDQPAWDNQRILEIQESIKNGELGHRSRFVLDFRWDRSGFFGAKEDDDDGNALVFRDDYDDLDDYDYGHDYGYDGNLYDSDGYES